MESVTVIRRHQHKSRSGSNREAEPSLSNTESQPEQQQLDSPPNGSRNLTSRESGTEEAPPMWRPDDIRNPSDQYREEDKKDREKITKKRGKT